MGFEPESKKRGDWGVSNLRAKKSANRAIELLRGGKRKKQAIKDEKEEEQSGTEVRVRTLLGLCKAS